MKCKELFEVIDRIKEPYTDMLADVCRIESPTDDKAGVDRVGQYFIDLAEKRGWEIEVSRQSVSGDAICITLNPHAKGAPVAVSAHMDTVFPVGSWGEPVVRREGDRLYGPGTKDCKGGLVAAMLAMDALCEIGYDERPVLFLLQSDEEKGSTPSNKETINYICKKAEGSVAFLNLEGIRNGTAVLSRKGIWRVKFTVQGKAAHSSECGGGINAVAEAAHKILEIEKYKDADGITCNCGLISGGTAANTVPELCEFVVDIRFLNAAQKAEIEQNIRAIAAHTYLEGCRTTLTEVSYRPPMEYCERNAALLAKMNEIYAANGLPTLTCRAANGGSDAAYVTECGIPCVDSIGVAGGPIHTMGEYASIASIAEAAKRVAAVIYCL
ncbi:MAG: M20/M25/M40 family metallo-hydrolase [Clostridia bacterium]|nr:M20/M25/M40 family metallo-hydrolase [Clostridia bacterium]